MRLHVIARTDRIDVPVPGGAAARPTYFVSLQSRERAGLEPIALPVSQEQWVELQLGTEVELAIRPVRS